MLTRTTGIYRASVAGLLPAQGPYRVELESAGGRIAVGDALDSAIEIEAGAQLEIGVGVAGS